MLNLLLTILFTSWLLISFRLFQLFKINTLQAIIFNYIVCACIGLFFAGNYATITTLKTIETWMVLAIITGACFLPTFLLMALTVERISVTISSIASKTSLIIPVTVSLVFLNDSMDFSVLNFIGLIVGFGAIILSAVKKEAKPLKEKNNVDYFLPILVFLGGGLIDVMINVTNFLFLPANKSSLFPFFAFSTAASIGFIVLIYRVIKLNEKIYFKNILGGIALGIPNYLSIFFLLKSLRDYNNNGALLFPIVNICVILFTTGIAILFFKEKLTRYNYIGLALSIVALSLLISI